MKRLSLTILAVGLALPVLAQGDGAVFGGATTQARMLLSAQSARPGETIWAGLELKMAPGWHTYWRYGGDAGLATTAKWTLPPGLSAGEIQWPHPGKIGHDRRGPLALHLRLRGPGGVAGSHQAGRGFAPGPVQLGAELGWLECKDSCVPCKAAVSASLTVGAEDKPSANAGLLEEWRARLPQTSVPLAAAARWESPAPASPRALIIDWEIGEQTGRFLPLRRTGGRRAGGDGDFAGRTGPRSPPQNGQEGEGPWPERLAGILVATNNSQRLLAVEVNLPRQDRGRRGFAGGAGSGVADCVPGRADFERDAVRAAGHCAQGARLCQSIQGDAGRVKRLGLVYGAGVLMSFLVLAGLAIGTQQAGGAAGCGDAIRHPQFRVILTVLMTLIALNLFGLFEINLGAGMMGSASGLASRHGYGGAFCNGVLATVWPRPAPPRIWPARWRSPSPSRPSSRCWCFWRLARGWPFPLC